jgi:RimJ/RimL family protein N-acetyltransferase
LTPLIVETPRLILRQWRDSDLDPWAEMNADPRVMEFFPGTYDRARSEETANLMRISLERDGYGLWAVELKGDGRFAGMIGINEMTYDVPFEPRREVGWRLAYDAWGHGYATEGARASLRVAFETLGWDEVVAMTALCNQRSERVMQRLGMVRDADFDHPRLAKGHRLRRHMLYRIRKDAMAYAND